MMKTGREDQPMEERACLHTNLVTQISLVKQICKLQRCAYKDASIQ